MSETWWYVMSRNKNWTLDLQRFSTKTEARFYCNDKQNESWDSIILQKSDLDLFNFFDDDEDDPWEDKGTTNQIGKL